MAEDHSMKKRLDGDTQFRDLPRSGGVRNIMFSADEPNAELIFV